MECAPSLPIACATPVPPHVAPPACEPRVDSRPTEAWLHDDPFARQAGEPVFASSREFTLVTDPGLADPGRRLARFDPDASPEDADERTGPHWVPLEWAHRTLRTRAFVAGMASGAVVCLFGVWASVVAAGRSVTVVAMPSSAEPETAVAAPLAPPPQKPLKAAGRTRKAPSPPTAPDRTMITAAAGPRSPSTQPMNSEPKGSMTKARELVVAAMRSEGPESVRSVDSEPVPARADPGEPAAEDSDAVAEATGGAPESGDAADQEDGARRDNAAEPETVAHEADHQTPGRMDAVAEDDDPPASAATPSPHSAAMPSDDSIASAEKSIVPGP